MGIDAITWDSHVVLTLDNLQVSERKVSSRCVCVRQDLYARIMKCLSTKPANGQSMARRS